MKKILIVLLVVFCIPLLWILIEYIHFEVLSYDKPIITLDETFCSKDSMGCYNKNGDYTHSYYGIGFYVKVTYHLNDREYNKYSMRAYDYTVTKRRFYPFSYGN